MTTNGYMTAEECKAAFPAGAAFLVAVARICFLKNLIDEVELGKRLAHIYAAPYRNMSIDELRTIACKFYITAYRFACSVDECFHWETYQGVLGTKYEEYYLYLIGIMDIKTKE